MPLLNEKKLKVLKILSEGLATTEGIEHSYNMQLLSNNAEFQKLTSNIVSRRTSLGQCLLQIRKLESQRRDIKKERDHNEKAYSSAIESKREVESNLYTVKKLIAELKRTSYDIKTNVEQFKFKEKMGKYESVRTHLENELRKFYENVPSADQFEAYRKDVDSEIQGINNDKQVLIEETQRAEQEIEDIRAKREKYMLDMNNNRKAVQSILKGLRRDEFIKSKKYPDRQYERMQTIYVLTKKGKKAIAANGYNVEEIRSTLPNSATIPHEAMVSDVSRNLRMEASEFNFKLYMIDESTIKQADHTKKQYPDLDCKLGSGKGTFPFCMEIDKDTESPPILFKKVIGHETVTLVLFNSHRRIKNIAQYFHGSLQALSEEERHKQINKIFFKLHKDFLRDGFFSRWITIPTSNTTMISFDEIELKRVYLDEVLDMAIFNP